MKKTTLTYIKAILFFLIPFIFISFILALLSYFIHLNYSFTHLLIQIVSYVLLIVSALYFSSSIQSHRLTHCLAMSVFYFLMSLLDRKSVV